MSDNLGAGHPSARMPTSRLLVLTILFIILAAAATAGAQDCKVKASTTAETPVFERPATQFNTAKGWVYGTPVAVLAPNVTVFLCAEQTVWFGVISQGWSEIAYWTGGRWEHGWVVSQNLRRATADQRSTSLACAVLQAFSLPSAHAQLPVITESPPSDAPPAPPAPRRVSPDTLIKTEDSALARFYGWLFVFMILGMLGKITFDMLTEPGKLDWKARARAGILPLIVSPIVFLGIMNAADSTAAATLSSFIALCCSAFQNGFFWHTILDRAGGVSGSAK
jgi:hypothetical protein